MASNAPNQAEHYEYPDPTNCCPSSTTPSPPYPILPTASQPLPQADLNPIAQPTSEVSYHASPTSSTSSSLLSRRTLDHQQQQPQQLHNMNSSLALPLPPPPPAAPVTGTTCTKQQLAYLKQCYGTYPEDDGTPMEKRAHKERAALATGLDYDVVGVKFYEFKRMVARAAERAQRRGVPNTWSLYKTNRK